jgi:hypothetical protein
MRKLLLTTGMAAVLALAAGPALAEDPDESYRFEFRMEEGLDKLKDGLEEMLRSLPRYERPYIDENGDIIIRRLPPFEFDLDRLFGPEEPEFADI